ncbi:MAG TPA: hypothetical protein VNM67_19275 [Thermoanaerobaculia bacterium]|jgi:hypothetical protein|nr:hypothetical protein [Thermoanaerobaculia bacterium]
MTVSGANPRIRSNQAETFFGRPAAVEMRFEPTVAASFIWFSP